MKINVTVFGANANKSTDCFLPSHLPLNWAPH